MNKLEFAYQTIAKLEAKIKDLKHPTPQGGKEGIKTADVDKLITKHACREYLHEANEPQFDCDMVEFIKDDLYLLLKEYSDFAAQFTPKMGEDVEQAADIAGAAYYRKEKPANTYTFHEGFKQGVQWLKDQWQASQQSAKSLIKELDDENIRLLLELKKAGQEIISLQSAHLQDKEVTALRDALRQIRRVEVLTPESEALINRALTQPKQ